MLLLTAPSGDRLYGIRASLTLSTLRLDRRVTDAVNLPQVKHSISHTVERDPLLCCGICMIWMPPLCVQIEVYMPDHVIS